jgi:hypothetical protein
MLASLSSHTNTCISCSNRKVRASMAMAIVFHGFLRVHIHVEYGSVVLGVCLTHDHFPVVYVYVCDCVVEMLVDLIPQLFSTGSSSYVTPLQL